jgi:hypothetical protein
LTFQKIWQEFPFWNHSSIPLTFVFWLLQGCETPINKPSSGEDVCIRKQKHGHLMSDAVSLSMYVKCESSLITVFMHMIFPHSFLWSVVCLCFYSSEVFSPIWIPKTTRELAYDEVFCKSCLKDLRNWLISTHSEVSQNSLSSLWCLMG